jgi:hypothetical protein
MARSLLLDLLAPLAVLGAVALVPRPAAADCPGTLIYCRGTTELVPGDQGSRFCPYDDETGSYGGGSFDQTQGTNRIDSRFLNVQLAAADTFWFEGPVVGDSVKCRALLDINARACGGDRALVSATFALAPGYTQTYGLSAPSPLECRNGSATYNQLVALRVGEKFVMTLELTSFEAAGGDGFIATALHFDQLPTGVSVRSCHGFRQDGPVPAVRDSWGAVKAIYRR